MDFVKNLEIYELLIFIAAGLAVLFFGYRIKKVAFFIIWFLLGYNLTQFLLPTATQILPDIAKEQLFQILFPICGGLLLGLLGFTIEKFCVGGITFLLVMLITVRYFGTEVQTLAIGAVISIVASAAAVALMKPAIIVATSAAGAYAISLAIFSLIKDLSFETYYWPLIIGITLIGALFQFSTTKRIR